MRLPSGKYFADIPNTEMLLLASAAGGNIKQIVETLTKSGFPPYWEKRRNEFVKGTSKNPVFLIFELESSLGIFDKSCFVWANSISWR